MNKDLTQDSANLEPKRIRPSLVDRAAGDAAGVAAFLSPMLPSELVAGSVPQVAGAEEETIWNAAVQACGTERIHFCYTIEGGRCWYLATPSSSLSSFPNSWCPLAAALPGNSEFWDKETVYLYEQDGQAGALRWDADSGRMQLFLGPARTILPRIQSMDANFVSISAQTATVVPWINRDLKIEQLSRAAGRTLLYSGLLVTFCALISLFFTYFTAAFLEPKLENARTDTEAASNKLMQNAMQTLENDAVNHFIRIQRILDELYRLKGTLVRYEVKDNGAVEWEALVPAAYTTGSSEVLRGAIPIGGVERDGRVRLRGTR